MNLDKKAAVVAGIASAVVGGVCLAALVFDSNTGSKSSSGRSGKKSKSRKKSKPKRKVSRELVLSIEKECIAEFKLYLPKLSESEQRMFAQAQAAGKQLTQEDTNRMQETLIKQMEMHLESHKKKLCEQNGIDEQAHDDLVHKLVETNDPDIVPLMEESKKLWSVFAANQVELPDHVDEEVAIQFVTRSFQLVIDAFGESRKEFIKDESPESIAKFQHSIKTDQAMCAVFNRKFQTLVAESKAKLQQEFQLPNNEQVMATIIAKYQGSPKFSRAVAKARAKMDAFFQSA